MKLLLIRHGQPDEHDALQPHDPPLTAAGLEQARSVGRLLTSEPLTHIVSSPLQRAQATAAPLAAHTGLPVRIMPGWAEADRNAARYRSLETLRAQGDGEWRRFLQDPIRYLGADPAQFLAEVFSALGETLRLAPDGTVAVFTHGMPINVVLSHALGLPGFVHFAPGHGSVTRLRAHSPERMGVVSVNELWHKEHWQQ